VCMVTVYKGSVEETNKLASDVSSYKLDLSAKKLTVYSMFKEPQEFMVTKGLSWDESSDSMIID